MSVPVTLEALDLAALLCSRVCHDLISPAGAILNGFEVLEDSDDEETRGFALDLIRKSARTASARLQFCRVAFGAAGSSTAHIDLGDAEALTRGFVEAEKVRLSWNLPRAAVPKSRVRLLMNMILVAAQAIPRGGVLTVDADGALEAMTFRITARGVNARVFDQVPALLAGRPESGTVDAQGIQPYYTGLLARAIGLDATIAADGDAVVVAARPQVQAPVIQALVQAPVVQAPVVQAPVIQAPVQVPGPASVQVPVPASVKVPVPASVKVPVPAPVKVPIPAPAQAPAPVPAQATVPAPTARPVRPERRRVEWMREPAAAPLNGQHVGTGRLAPQGLKARGGVERERP